MSPVHAERGQPLSPREIEALGFAAAGRPDAEIAGLMHVSTTTVASHLRRVYQKLGANGRENAVLLAMRAGVIR